MVRKKSGFVKNHVTKRAVSVGHLGFVELFTGVIHQGEIGLVVDFCEVSVPEVEYRFANQYLTGQPNELFKCFVTAEIFPLSIFIKNGGGDGIDHGLRQISSVDAVFEGFDFFRIHLACFPAKQNILPSFRAYMTIYRAFEHL